MPTRPLYWSRHGLLWRLLAGNSGCTPVKPWSMSSNITPAPRLIQERDAIGRHLYQQPRVAAALVGRLFDCLEVSLASLAAVALSKLPLRAAARALGMAGPQAVGRQVGPDPERNPAVHRVVAGGQDLNALGGEPLVGCAVGRWALLGTSPASPEPSFMTNSTT